MQITFEPMVCEHSTALSAPLQRLLEKEYFRPADTKLSYRQIDLLKYAGLLKNEENGKWKKFDAKDLVFLKVISELKRFGLGNSQLQGIRQVFYAEKNWGLNADGLQINNVMDYVLFEIFKGVEWILMVRPNGDISVHEKGSRFLTLDKYISCVHLNLASLIIQVALTITGNQNGKDDTKPLSLLIEGLLRDEKFDELGREFLSLLKSKKYREITIVKKDGDEVVIKAKNTKNSTSPDIFRVLSSIEGHDFQKIEVTTRKKKPTCYAYTDIFKGKYLKVFEKLD